MQCNAMQCNASNINATQRATQRNATQYNAIQCNTIQYNTMQYKNISSVFWNSAVINNRSLEQNSKFTTRQTFIPLHVLLSLFNIKPMSHEQLYVPGRLLHNCWQSCPSVRHSSMSEIRQLTHSWLVFFLFRRFIVLFTCFLNLFLFYQVVQPLGRKSVNKYLYLYLYKTS